MCDSFQVCVALCLYMIACSMQAVVNRFTCGPIGWCNGMYAGCAWVVAVGSWEGVCVSMVPVGSCMYPADIDDCANSPCCQQVCANTPGGYECNCYAGYRLNPDGCACEGEHMLPGSSWVTGGEIPGSALALLRWTCYRPASRSACGH